MADLQQRPGTPQPARVEKLAAVAAAVADARRGARRGEPAIDEGVRLIRAFRQIADPAARRKLVEHAEDLARSAAIKGKTG